MKKKIIGVIAMTAFLCGCSASNTQETNEMKPATTDENIINYSCNDQKLEAKFNTDGDTVELFFAEKKAEPVKLKSVVSASGAKYSNGKIIFWEHQGDAYLQMDGEESESVKCVLESTK